MDITHIEHQAAPRLEMDVQRFFKQIRYSSPEPGVDYDEYQKKLMIQASKVFLEYFRDWNFLMFSHREAEVSFWIAKFRDVYFSVLQQVSLGSYFFVPDAHHSEQWLINHILLKLSQWFKTTGFNEDLNQSNEQHEKRIDQIRERYAEVSKLSVDAPDLRFYLSYPMGTEQLQSVDQVVRSFFLFEKKLKSQPWFRGQVIFSYYHLIRDSIRNCYVIRFFLTFQKAIYNADVDYSTLIGQLWQDATIGLGILLEVSDEASQKPLSNPFGIGRDEIMEYPEPRNPLEDLGDLPNTVSSVEEKMNKICVVTRGFQIFQGKKFA